MKRFFLFIFILITVFTLSVNAKSKVKVYVFEAGGCPYCEQEIEYLESLSSYGTKFEIVRKELYIDHVNWEKGKDYDLGVKLTEEFNKAGFNDADYNGTPLVIISDLYAATGYNTNLESYINDAYKNGDADIVSCVSKNNNNCIKTYDQSSGSYNNSFYIQIAVSIFCTFVIIIVYLINSKRDMKLIKEMMKK